MHLTPTLGAAASASWLEARELDVRATPHWFVEIAIDSRTLDSRFELNIYPEEWGFAFRRGTRASSIRITDIAFVHGLDDFQLQPRTPALERIADLLRELEQRHEIAIDRANARVRSNLVRAKAVVRAWLLAA